MKFKKLAWGGSLYLLPVLIVLVWWFVSADNSSTVFPPLREDLLALQRFWLFDHFASDLLPSVTNFVVGFVIAIAVGVAGGIPLGLSARGRHNALPLLEFFRALPIATVLPAALIIFGSGHLMEISLIAFATTWPILLNTIDGIRYVDPQIMETARVYGLNNRQRTLFVAIPAASPQIFAGGRIAISIGVLTMILSTMIGASSGLGFQVIVAQQSFDSVGAWAGLILIGVIGCILNALFAWLQHATTAWHEGWRETVMA